MNWTFLVIRTFFLIISNQLKFVKITSKHEIFGVSLAWKFFPVMAAVAERLIHGSLLLLLPDKNYLIAAATRVQNILNHAWDTFAAFNKDKMFSLNNTGSSIYRSEHTKKICVLNLTSGCQRSIILVSIALLFVHLSRPPLPPFVIRIYLFSDPYPCHDTHTTHTSITHTHMCLIQFSSGCIDYWMKKS